jgi:hypothetical protein
LASFEEARGAIPRPAFDKPWLQSFPVEKHPAVNAGRSDPCYDCVVMMPREFQ